VMKFMGMACDSGCGIQLSTRDVTTGSVRTSAAIELAMLGESLGRAAHERICRHCWEMSTTAASSPTAPTLLVQADEVIE
jgi:hypothetical protein